MALATPSQTTSYDQSGVYKLDLSEVLSAILLDDTDFVSYHGISGEVATQTKHEWVEDTLNATTIQQIGGSGLTSAGTALAVSASHLTRITAGTLLRDQLSGKTEVLQVTAVGAASATITRGFGSSSAEAHAASAVWEIIAHPRPQGMSGPKDESTTRTKPFNYTQIFSKGVKITGTAEAIDHAGLTSEQEYQIDMRLRELKRELDRSTIMGIRNGQPADASYGSMAGIIEWTSLLNTGNRVTTAETLTPSVLNTLIKNCWDAGLDPDTVLVGGVQKQKVSAFDQEYRRSTLDTRRAGYTVEEFVSDLGINLRVVVDRWVPNDVCIVYKKSQVKIMPLRSRAFFLERLGKTGDSWDWQIVGEYTMEMRNASAASCHTNLKQ